MMFLIAALVLFVAYNILPDQGGRDVGWHIWPELWKDMLHDPQSFFRDSKLGIIISSFLCFSLIIVVSPFLKNVWPKSRLAWWGVMAFSGLTSVGFWGVFCVKSSNQSLGTGLWCLLFAPVLNFIGLLLARPQWLERKHLDGGSPL